MDRRPVAMPLKEFELLSVLMRNAGKVLTRREMLHAWGADCRVICHP